jgi:GNAT superfamily N-acetyltransferase
LAGEAALARRFTKIYAVLIVRKRTKSTLIWCRMRALVIIYENREKEPMAMQKNAAAKVSIRVLPNSPLGWVTAQSLFNQSPQVTQEFFRHGVMGREGQLFFERVLADKAANKVEIFEIVLHTEVAQSVGLMTLGTGYAESAAAYLHFMFVAESHRGMGIGSQAVRQLENYAQNTSSHLTLVVALPESPTTRFWTQLGYERCGGLDANLKNACHGAIVEKLVKPLGEGALVTVH